LSLHTYDPDYIYFADPYEVTFKTDSISTTIPTVEARRSLLFRYQPSVKDTEYARLADRILPIAQKEPTGEDGGKDLATHPDQQPPVGRDPMNFRQEQKAEIAQLTQANKSTSQESEAHLPETGETANIWTVYGLLTVLATSLWKVVYRRKEDQ